MYKHLLFSYNELGYTMRSLDCLGQKKIKMNR